MERRRFLGVIGAAVAWMSGWRLGTSQAEGDVMDSGLVQSTSAATVGRQGYVTATFANPVQQGNTVILIHFHRQVPGVPTSSYPGSAGFVNSGSVAYAGTPAGITVYCRPGATVGNSGDVTFSAATDTATAQCLVAIEVEATATPIASLIGGSSTSAATTLALAPNQFGAGEGLHLAIIGANGTANFLDTWTNSFGQIGAPKSTGGGLGASSQAALTVAASFTDVVHASGTAETWSVSRPYTYAGLSINVTSDTLPPPPAATFSGNVTLESLEIPAGATANFDPDVSTTVTVSGNVVVEGTLQMHPASASVVHTLQFAGIDEENYVGGGDEVLESDIGLWLMEEGLLDAVGTTRTPWVRTTTSLSAAATSATLASAPAGWQIGDTIVICPTSPTTTATNWDTFDETTISTIAGTALTFPALTYAHPTVAPGDGNTYGAEILNLTRNVIIQGESATQRAHIFHSNHSHETNPEAVPQTVSYVSLRYLGPRTDTDFILGRYAWHGHHSGDLSRGSVFTGLVARDIGSHCFVSHDSHGMTWDSCIAYKFNEEAFWWDIKDGAPPNLVASDPTHDTMYLNCVAAKGLIATGSELKNLNGFSLGRGKDNSAIGCVAVGIQGIVNASGYEWPGGVADSQWVFTDCVAHNNKVHGIFIWQNSTRGHVLTRPVCFHNGAYGLSHGAYGNGYQFLDGVFYANASGPVLLHAASKVDTALSGQIEFTDCLFDGNDLAGVLYCIAEAKHSAAPEQTSLFDNCTFKRVTGTHAAAIGITQAYPLVRNPIWLKVQNCTFTSIDKYYFSDDCHPGSYIEDVATNTSYQHKAKSGTLDATANSRTNSPPATRTAT
jgi:hypothetical protein